MTTFAAGPITFDGLHARRLGQPKGVWPNGLCRAAAVKRGPLFFLAVSVLPSGQSAEHYARSHGHSLYRPQVGHQVSQATAGKQHAASVAHGYAGTASRGKSKR